MSHHLPDRLPPPPGLLTQEEKFIVPSQGEAFAALFGNELEEEGGEIYAENSSVPTAPLWITHRPTVRPDTEQVIL